MGKTVLVLGAVGGVGSAAAKMLVADGWKVIGTVRSSEQMDEVLADVPGISDVATVDLSDADHVGAALKSVLQPGMQLDAVVMAAAVCPFGPLETTPLSELRRVFEINVLGCLAVYQATIELLRQSRGHLVITTSHAGKVAFPFIGHYSASKFALEAIADVMRRELRGSGVKIVVVEPGGMKSRMVELQHREILSRQAALSDAERERYGHFYDAHERTVAGRGVNMMPPEECAEVIVRALQANEPDTRYTSGVRATKISALPRTMTDREIDEATVVGL